MDGEPAGGLTVPTSTVLRARGQLEHSSPPVAQVRGPQELGPHAWGSVALVDVPVGCVLDLPDAGRDVVAVTGSLPVGAVRLVVACDLFGDQDSGRVGG